MKLTTSLLHRLKTLSFPGSAAYWEDRYRRGRTSGAGSAGAYADFKSTVMNDLLSRLGVRSVVEFGCGDGAVLGAIDYPKYVGLDVSVHAIATCAAMFEDDDSKSFFRYDPHAFADRSGLFVSDMSVSLDVLFHLVEDDVFDRYMRHLFAAATRFVVIYSTDCEVTGSAPHVRHRPISPYVAVRFPDWKLLERIANPAPPHPETRTSHLAEFMVYGAARDGDKD
jgi:SAM-dependent methyltransferase